MKLEYKILCIDDKIDSLDDDKAYMSAFNKTVGIKLDYHDVPVTPKDAFENPDEVYLRVVSIIEEEFKENIFDLILVDLHMPGKIDGKEIITIIRKKHTFYRPILFYSGGEPLEDEDKAIEQLNEATDQEGLSGKSIFIVSRNGLYAKTEEIFGEMHKEERTINRSRGLLMDSVSELDASIVELILEDNLWNKVEDDGVKTKIATDFRSLIKKDYDDAKKLFTDMERFGFQAVRSHIKDNPLDVSTFNKGNLLRLLLKKIDELKENGDVLSEGINGEESLRNLRNVYGHTKAEDLKQNHTDEKCLRIRTESRRQLKNIDDILNKL